MTMTVSRRKETKQPSVIIHKIADVRGGVSIKTSTLGGDFVYDGTPITAPKDGICEVIKVATVAKTTTTSEKTLVVTKQHNFKAGDSIVVSDTVTAKVDKVDSTGRVNDVLTLSAAVGSVVKAGTMLAEPTTAKKPFAIIGTTKQFSNVSNLDADAWLFAVTKGNPLPAAVAAELKGIINYD